MPDPTPTAAPSPTPEPSVIRGRVLGPDGLAARRVQVTAFGSAESYDIVRRTLTNGEGEYILRLSPGTYVLFYSPPLDSGLGPIWSGGVPSRDGAASHAASPGSSPVDVELPPGHVVTGSFPPAYTCPLLQTQIGSSFSEAGDRRTAVCKMDEDNTSFRIVVPPGSYYVRFSKRGERTSLWWHAGGTAVSANQATVLRVTSDVSDVTVRAP